MEQQQKQQPDSTQAPSPSVTTTSSVVTAPLCSKEDDCNVLYCKLARVFVMTVMSCVSITVGLFALMIYALTLILYVITSSGKYGSMLCGPMYKSIIPMCNAVDAMGASCWECMHFMRNDDAGRKLASNGFTCTTLLTTMTKTSA